MNTEQEQRIEQIRERWSADQPLPNLRITAFQDVQFLLSVVEEQEATVEVSQEQGQMLEQVRAARLAGRLPWSHWSSPTRRDEMAAGILDLLISLLDGPARKHLAALTQNSINYNSGAESMRSLCVEKVKGMKRSTTGLAFSESDALIQAIEHRNAILGEVVIELESLSIQEQKS